MVIAHLNCHKKSLQTISSLSYQTKHFMLCSWCCYLDTRWSLPSVLLFKATQISFPSGSNEVAVSHNRCLWQSMLTHKKPVSLPSWKVPNLPCSISFSVPRIESGHIYCHTHIKNEAFTHYWVSFWGGTKIELLF